MRTLLDYMVENDWIDKHLYDGPSGLQIADDNPSEFEILACVIREPGSRTFLAVRGPSDQIDVADMNDGARLHRDAIMDASELDSYVDANW